MTAPAAELTAPEAAPRAAVAGRRLAPETATVAVIAVVALADALLGHAHHFSAVADLARGAAATVLLFAVCGWALCDALVPAEWGALRPILVLPLGAAASALALTALGFAHVPLSVSVWVVLAAGVAGTVLVRRAGLGRGPVVRPAARATLSAWLALAFVLFCVALIPAWRTGAATIYGVNPDSHQVAGIAVLFQHVPPTATDDALPIDVVPPAWRFRYPIFYGLAAVSNLSHLDPIVAFPAMAALLVVIAALGFGAVGVCCLRLPVPAGMALAAVLGMWSIALHLAWHPYWNQLWGIAMLPYALLFGWWAIATADRRAAALLVLVLVTLWLAYPLALPYPLLLLAALLAARGARLRLPRLAGRRAWIGGTVGVLVLLPAVAGAAVKLGQGVSQILSPHSSLWGGDVIHPMPVGAFAGTGGGIVPALAVAALALVGLSTLPRRPRLAVGIVLAVLCLLDLRFRLARTGAYMDFKHLSFVGALVLMFAVAGVVTLLRSPRRPVAAAGVVVAAAWVAAALWQDHREAVGTGEQVTPEMFAIREWARELPRGASVRVDIPPSGVQLWAVYMLDDHPVDSPAPVLYTTYAHAPYGLRAQYSLSLTKRFSRDPRTARPYPTPLYARNPPLRRNDEFTLRRIAWPARLARYPETASTALVEP